MIEYARKTKKSCNYCHVKIGGGGELTPEGKKFRDNGYTLLETQYSFTFTYWTIIISFSILVGLVSFLFLRKRERAIKPQDDP